MNIVKVAIFIGEEPKNNSRYLIIIENNITHKGIIISIEKCQFITGINPLIDNFFDDED